LELNDIAIIRGIRFLFCDMWKWIVQGCQNLHGTPILHWASHWHLFSCVHHVCHIRQDGYRKILGHVRVAPITTSDRKWISIANLVVTKKFNHQACDDWNFFVTIFSMCHWGLAIYLEEYLKAKEELWKFQYFTMQKYDL
jgi:hypothetical protein